MPIEPVWIHAGPAGSVLRCCSRCGSVQVRGLGHAGSNLLWFACYACSHVWGLREQAGDASRPVGPSPTASALSKDS